MRVCFGWRLFFHLFRLGVVFARAREREASVFPKYKVTSRDFFCFCLGECVWELIDRSILLLWYYYYYCCCCCCWYCVSLRYCWLVAAVAAAAAAIAVAAAGVIIAVALAR
jgi:hypothetical protein